MSHGGRRKGAGGPITTGSSLRPPVFFRLSLEDYDTAAERTKGNVNAQAKRLMLRWLAGSEMKGERHGK